MTWQTPCFEVARRLAEGHDPPVVVLVSSREASEFGRHVGTAGAQGFMPKDELSGHRWCELARGAS